jgi:hypothetical protein
MALSRMKTFQGPLALFIHCSSYFFRSAIAPRINRPGGTGRITQIHYAMAEDCVTGTPVVEALDVKYTVYAGHDHHLSPDLVQPHVELESRGRRQRGGQIVAAAAENENPNRTTALSAASPKQLQPIPKRAKSRSNRVFSAKKGKNELATAAPKAKATSRKKSTPIKRKPKNESRKPKRSLFKTEESAADHAAIETGATGIPREITVDTSFSVASSVLPQSEASCSPLGPDGIEMQRSASYDLDEMAGMQLNDGQWDESELSKGNDDTMSDDGNDQRRSLCVLHLQLSPSPSHAGSSLRRRKSSSLSATHLATGRYSVEGVYTPPKGSRSEKMKAETNQQKPISHSNEQHQSAPTDNLATLRNVFDHGVKQARRFIGEVVSGVVPPSTEQPTATTTTAAEDERIRHFYGLLLDMLAECGDVIEMSSLAQTLANREDLNDFTDREIESYLKQLCERDKIMLSEGCIYKI